MKWWVVPLALAIGCQGASTTGRKVLVQSGEPIRYLANASDPGIGSSWLAPDYDDSDWQGGTLGIGREDKVWCGVRGIAETEVPLDTLSIYVRQRFVIEDRSAIRNLFLGVDYDDGYVAWINGQEIARSPTMPPGAPAWNTKPASHESSNGANPLYERFEDVSARGVPALRTGDNVFAIAVWSDSTRSDIVVAPKLIANQPDGIFVTRGPYLQLSSDTGVLVRWRTNEPTDSRVLFGVDPSALTKSAADSTVTTDHAVRLSGLSPDTRVYYAVGSSSALLEGGDPDYVFKTQPAAGASSATRIWVTGDSGTADCNVAAVRNAFEWYNGDREISLWLSMGDNAYPDGTDETYQLAFFNTFPQQLARIPVWSTVGNHDPGPPHGAYYDVFDNPTRGESGGVASDTEAYFSFDHGETHFIDLNSEIIDTSAGGAMLDWLRRDLAATSARWTVVFFHHAPYSAGRHESDSEEEMTAMRAEVLPILDAGGVDLVLTGHTHAYARSYLLRGHYGPTSTLIPEMILDSGTLQDDGSVIYRKYDGANQGIVYLVVGCTGEAVETELDLPEIAMGLTRRGSVILEIDGDRLSGDLIGVDGFSLDHFTIEKLREDDAGAITAPGATVAARREAETSSDGGPGRYDAQPSASNRNGRERSSR